MRNVVLVPRETIASSGRSGSARIVAGLSPVKGVMEQDSEKSQRDTKYLLMGPRCFPPSSYTGPSLAAKPWKSPFDASESNL